MAIKDLRPPLSTARKSIIDFSRSQVSYSVLKAMDLLLSPCCNPELLAGVLLLAEIVPPTFELSNFICRWDSVDFYGLTMNITVSDPSLAGQTVQVLLVSTTNESLGEAGSAVNITLDNTGSWTGIIQTPMQGCPFPGPFYEATFILYIISQIPGVVHTSLPETFSVPVCC